MRYTGWVGDSFWSTFLPGNEFDVPTCDVGSIWPQDVTSKQWDVSEHLVLGADQCGIYVGQTQRGIGGYLYRSGSRLKVTSRETCQYMDI